MTGQSTNSEVPHLSVWQSTQETLENSQSQSKNQDLNKPQSCD